MVTETETRPVPRTRAADWPGLRAALRDDPFRADVVLPIVPRAALSRQIGSMGGYAALPDTLADAVEVALTSSVMRRLAEVVRKPGAAAMDWVTANPGSGSAGEGELVGEGQSFTELEPTFGRMDLQLFKFGSKKLFVPNEIFEDGKQRALNALLVTCMRRIARLQNRLFTTGTGGSQPLGVSNAAPVQVTTVAPTVRSITIDNLIDLYTSLDTTWWEADIEPVWMMSPSTFGTLAKMRDGVGLNINLLRRSLLDSPIVSNAHMPAIASGSVPILFGRFDYYKIRDDAAARFTRAVEAVNAIEQDQSLVWAALQSDGNLLIADPNAPPVVALQIGVLAP